MVRVEIHVDRRAEQVDRPQRRMPREAKIEQPPAARDVAADRRIHESGEQRHAGDAEERRFGIDPGADAGLEYFHDRADDVEQENDLGLLQRLQLERQHTDLDRERGEKEKIVARQRRPARIPQMRTDEQRHHRPAEQAGPSLLHAEAKKLVAEGRRRPLARPMAELRLRIDEGRERRPAGGSARCRWSRLRIAQAGC